jgi:hypothetical protein
MCRERVRSFPQHLLEFFKPQFQLRRVCVGQTFPRPASHPINPLPLLCFRPNPPHHRLNNRHNMSAIFNFSSLLTVLLLVICTCAYLRDLRPTIFDSGQVRTENKPLQTNTGERNYSIINNLTFVSAPCGNRFFNRVRRGWNELVWQVFCGKWAG